VIEAGKKPKKEKEEVIKNDDDESDNETSRYASFKAKSDKYRV
jgi:hypothetical protein